MSEGRSITVQGVGERRAVPDAVQAHLGVHAVAPAVGAALDACNALASAVLGAVRAAGVAEEDVQTSQVSAGQHWEPGGRQGGHRADHLFQVVCRDLEHAGAVVEAAARAAGDGFELHGLHPFLSDPAPLLEEAQDDAVADARARAERLAAAAGVTLGALRSLADGGSPFPLVGTRSKMSASAAAMEVAPGAQTIQARVTAVYDIAD